MQIRNLSPYLQFSVKYEKQFWYEINLFLRHDIPEVASDPDIFSFFLEQLFFVLLGGFFGGGIERGKKRYENHNYLSQWENNFYLKKYIYLYINEIDAWYFHIALKQDI